MKEAENITTDQFIADILNVIELIMSLSVEDQEKCKIYSIPPANSNQMFAGQYQSAQR